MPSPERRRSASPVIAPEQPKRQRSPHRSALRWKKKDHNRKPYDKPLDNDRERRRDHDGDSYRPKRYSDDSYRSKRQGDGRDPPEKVPEEEPKKSKAAEKPKAAPVTFIIVTVNDRLGTKARVPCLPDDTVGDFKKLVAAQIGRKEHEITLKRQGEKPFRDHITLADYGINNGVQLDLELGTGD
jgi:hypothetical protein